MRYGVAQLLPALLAASSPLLGCDPTSGFADTADAALPSVKRYFDGPGQKLSDGPWSRVVVDLDSDTLYHLGARRLDDEQPTFHLFDADAREGCSVSPNAGTWLMGKPEAAPFRLLPYLEEIDARGRGRLRFTTLDCEVQEIAVEDAGRPEVRLYDGGYLTPTKRGYSLVNPWSGDIQVLAEHLHEVLVWDRTVLLWADGKLKSFSDQFELGSELGDGVSAVAWVGQSFLMEDETGLSRVDFDRETLELLSTPVLEGACNLQLSRAVPVDAVGAWVSLAMPCDNPKPSLVHLDPSFEVLEVIEMPFEADARLARAMTDSATAGDEGALVAMAYLSEMDEDGFGPLWIYSLGSEAPILLGERADVESVFADPSESDWDGSARINYQELGDYLAHDWLHFGWDGSTEVIAERIVRNSASGQVLVNFDGVAGDLPLFDSDGVAIVAEKVPPNVDQAWSLSGPRRYARVDQFDGETGRVLLSNEFDQPSLWDPVATGVAPESLRFVWFMPALMFLENWDPENGTGDLVAYNYELEARATISEGVSSFDLTSYPWDGVVYTVPHGKRQGMWFSKAK
jgi:hypothetical protein